jgi:hypothetical protein
MPVQNNALRVNEKTARHPGDLVLPAGDPTILIQ